MTHTENLRQTITPQAKEALEELLEDRLFKRTAELIGVDAMKTSRVGELQGQIKELKALLRDLRG